MNLSLDVTKFPRSVYWKAFLALVILGTVLMFFVGEPPLGPYALYIVAGSCLCYILAFICLVLWFPKVFEWVIDIIIAYLVIGHLTSLVAVDLAKYFLYVPGLGGILFFVAVGGWIFLYPYAAYRFYRRLKPKKVPPLPTALP